MKIRLLLTSLICFFSVTDMMAFFQEVECLTPQNVQVTNVTSQSVDFSWTVPQANEGFASVLHQFAIITDESPVTGPVVPDTAASSASFFPLEPGTDYNLYVRTLCLGTWSDWTAVVSFSTLTCEAVDLPYSLDFEGTNPFNIPDCTTTETVSGNPWEVISYNENGFSGNVLAYQDHATAMANSWLFTRGFNMEQGTSYKVSFKYGKEGTGTPSLRVMLGDSPDITAMDNGIQFVNLSITETSAQTFSAGPFTVPQGGVFYFGFHANSAAQQGDIYMDDFIVEQWVCGTPVGIEVTDITTESAVASWTPGGDNMTHFFQYVVSEIELETLDGVSGIISTGSGSGNILEGLLPSTTYFLYVRSSCSGIWSDWEGPVQFTSACDPEAVSTPEGEGLQLFNPGDTLADLEVLSEEGTSIVWYDVETGGEPLESDTVLVDGTIYYAAAVTIDGCESTDRLPVQVEEALSRDYWNTQSFVLYPNPTSGEVTIDAGQVIDKIDVRTVSGQTVLNLPTVNQSKVSLSLNELPIGIYFITIHTDHFVSTQQIIRK